MAGFRRFRARYLPFLPHGKEIRRWRNKLLHKLGLTRAHVPACFLDQPELHYGSVLPLVVAQHVLEQGRLTFLQIGAYDGVVGDELLGLIQHYPVQGILVEPQPAAYQRLYELHKDNERLMLVNAAIDVATCKRPFYMPVQGDAECASFDRQHLLRHGFASDEINEIEVDCLTVDDILCLANLDAVDFLQVDAEGYDYEIIKSIDFEFFAPKILRFEYRHFSDGDLDACLRMLGKRGYRFLTDKLDLIAVRDATAASNSATIRENRETTPRPANSVA